MEDTRRVDFKAITNRTAVTERQRIIIEELERCGDGVLLTDLLSHKGDGGLLMMQIIDRKKDKEKRYHIRVIKDLWGKPVKQGDVVEWLYELKTRDAFGKKITTRHKKELARRGEIRQVEEWHSAVVDEYGCITVDFEDAAILLNTRGVHFESKHPLTNMREMSTKVTNGRHQHYWLYEEVPPWEYESLKKTRKQRSDKGKTRALSALKKVEEDVISTDGQGS